MKRVMMMLVPLLVLLIGGFGAWQYLQGQSKGNATEVAADAMVDVASAAAEWTTDKRSYWVELAHRVLPEVSGGRSAHIGVKTRLQVVGAQDRSRLCRLLPRVRDSVNVVLGGQLTGTDEAETNAALGAFGEELRGAINGALGAEDAIVREVQVSAGKFSPRAEGC